jgi:hypothetical protein
LAVGCPSSTLCYEHLVGIHSDSIAAGVTYFLSVKPTLVFHAQGIVILMQEIYEDEIGR